MNAVEEKEVWICADCLESHDEEVDKCSSCDSENICDMAKSDEHYFKYGTTDESVTQW